MQHPELFPKSVFPHPEDTLFPANIPIATLQEPEVTGYKAQDPRPIFPEPVEDVVENPALLPMNIEQFPQLQNPA
jgi:hypothetical protein